jgi:hypothetical protein
MVRQLVAPVSQAPSLSVVLVHVRDHSAWLRKRADARRQRGGGSEPLAQCRPGAGGLCTVTNEGARTSRALYSATRRVHAHAFARDETAAAAQLPYVVYYICKIIYLTIAPNNHDFDMQSLEGVTLPRTVAVRRPQ